MPLNTAQLNSRVAAGKPFIVGHYLGMATADLDCRVKGNPALKERRVVCKHTINTPGGICVYSEWLPVGAYLERDASGLVVKVILADKSEKKQTVKTMSEVVVDLTGYSRDGVGFDIVGTLSVIKEP